MYNQPNPKGFDRKLRRSRHIMKLTENSTPSPWELLCEVKLPIFTRKNRLHAVPCAERDMLSVTQFDLFGPTPSRD